jgi:glycosyltransferase involved in cell wall biosynthesis
LKSKPVILIFIDWYLPGYKAGGPITSCANLVDHLSDEFDFHIVTRDTDYTESRSYPDVKSDQWNLRPDGTMVYYFSKRELKYRNIVKLLRKTQYDQVYLNGIYSIPFTLFPLICLMRVPGVRIVLASRGMLAASAIRVKHFKKRAFLLVAKALGLFRSVLFHASTEAEKNDIVREFGSDCLVLIAGNLTSKILPVRNSEREKKVGMLRLVSIARIAPEKNLLFALLQLARLTESNGRVIFDIYGPVYDEVYWEKCKEQIAVLPENISVNYLGSIESRLVSETLGTYHFLFMPTAGENFGHIILQSLSAGCPVIISDQTPWRELPLINCGWDIALSDQAGFIKVLLAACAIGQEEFNSLSEHAFSYAQKYIMNSSSESDNRKLFR